MQTRENEMLCYVCKMWNMEVPATHIGETDEGTTRGVCSGSCRAAVHDRRPIPVNQITETEVAQETGMATRVWFAKDATQRISFPSGTNMLMATVKLCAAGILTERSQTSRYCLKAERVNS